MGCNMGKMPGPQKSSEKVKIGTISPIKLTNVRRVSIKKVSDLATEAQHVLQQYSAREAKDGGYIITEEDPYNQRFYASVPKERPSRLSIHSS